MFEFIAIVFVCIALIAVLEEIGVVLSIIIIIIVTISAVDNLSDSSGPDQQSVTVTNDDVPSDIRYAKSSAPTRVDHFDLYEGRDIHNLCDNGYMLMVNDSTDTKICVANRSY